MSEPYAACGWDSLSASGSALQGYGTIVGTAEGGLVRAIAHAVHRTAGIAVGSGPLGDGDTPGRACGSRPGPGLMHVGWPWWWLSLTVNSNQVQVDDETRMSHCQGYFMSQSTGDRVREVRGGMGVGEFAETLGVNRKTVTRWESGDSIPDGASLLALKRLFDADPSWLLTGQGPGLELSEDERELLALFRAAPLVGKMAAVGALQGVAAAVDQAKGDNSLVVKGSGHRVAAQGGNFKHYRKPKKE